jgi:anaerobic ribonucleoside-triphosphate reductase activating protein
MLVNGVTVFADHSLDQEEIIAIVEEEIKSWNKKGKALSTVELMVEGDDVVVKAQEKSPIRRLRRITGYLSNLEKFNDAKRSECLVREVHSL